MDMTIAYYFANFYAYYFAYYYVYYYVFVFVFVFASLFLKDQSYCIPMSQFLDYFPFLSFLLQSNE